MAARKKIKRQKNYIAIVLDRSTSIRNYGLTQAVINAFNAIKANLVTKSALPNQDTYVTLITFSDRPDVPLFKHANVNMIPDLDTLSYQPNGNTALLDATAKAIEIFDGVPVDESTSLVVMTLTDGEENQSVFTKADDLRRMITNREDAGNWTFAFQVPVGKRGFVCRSLGLSEDNVSEWEQTEIGTHEMARKTSGGLDNYYDARSRGLVKTQAMFKTTTDLSHVNVKKQLDDLSGQYRLFTVAAESVIRNFVEDKTGKDYIPGTAFYKLDKPEKVQPSKEVLIQEKTQHVPGASRAKPGKIFGGVDARRLIGLPDGQHAKVTPGNHDNYDIFIQSKSVNRILPRGTKLLVCK